MLHICRDFLAKSDSTITPNYRFYTAYLSACFLSGVLRYTQVGHTNFNIEGSSMTKGSGTNNANINLGGSLQYAVQLPGTYTVSASDLDRIIALKSNSNGKYNSGLFRISAFDTATNSVILNPRSWPTPPASELNMSWKIFEKEESITFLQGLNTQAAGTYRGMGNATTSRVILQSPHASGWQVRICTENSTDSTSGGQNSSIAGVSYAPGFNGNALGDFEVAGKHLHVPIFYNLGGSNTKLFGRTPGMGQSALQSAATNVTRYYFWGDDDTGSCYFITRQHGSLAGSEYFVCFGLPEEEETYNNQENIHRLFVVGNVEYTTIDSNQLQVNAGTRENDDNIMGTAFGFGMQPITCVPSSWCFLSANGKNGGIMDFSTAKKDSFTNKSELLKWDLIAGTYAYCDLSNPNVIDLEPRRIGVYPFARKGRKNYNNWSTSTEGNNTWLHTMWGVYLPWEGNVIP